MKKKAILIGPQRCGKTSHWTPVLLARGYERVAEFNHNPTLAPEHWADADVFICDPVGMVQWLGSGSRRAVELDSTAPLPPQTGSDQRIWEQVFAQTYAALVAQSHDTTSAVTTAIKRAYDAVSGLRGAGR